MGLTDKIKHAAEDLLDKGKHSAEGLTGKGKEALGKVRGDKSQETEGQVDQIKADTLDIGDNIKDAADPTD